MHGTTKGKEEDGESYLTTTAFDITHVFSSASTARVQNESLSLLVRACDDNNAILEDYANECQGLVWPLVEDDCASRLERHHDEVFKVEYHGQFYLKIIHSKNGGSDLKREITTHQ